MRASVIFGKQTNRRSDERACEKGKLSTSDCISSMYYLNKKMGVQNLVLVATGTNNTRLISTS